MKKDWKYYTGLVLFAWSFIAYGVLAGTTLLSISASAKAIISGILIASAEIAFFLSIILLGKTVVMGMKDKIKQWFGFGRKDEEESTVKETGISKVRHYTGVSMVLLSFLPTIISEVLLIAGFTNNAQIDLITWLLISGDILFVAGLCILGGEFWEKLKQLFTWPGDQNTIPIPVEIKEEEASAEL
ncbi:MAG: transporter suffix domain-containing protein [Firmicutes bacterium]|nr:transporter suffix domain-containing protein [Bacillota bacterium]